MKHSLLFVAIVAGTLTACQLIQEPTATVVEGTVSNKYTHQPLPGVKVMVRNWRYASYGGTTTDSIVSVFTDANGHYQLPFDATAKGTTYRIDIKNSRLVYDLTDYRKYDYYSATDGVSLTKGQVNKVDFEAIPYVPVKVYLDVDKQGASLLTTSFNADERDKQGFFYGSMLIDTARSTQHISTIISIKVIPYRLYFFNLSRMLVNCTDIYHCRNTYINSTQLTRYITYTDTTTIQLH